MKVINTKDVEPREVGGEALFTGGKVYLQPVLDGEHKGDKIRVSNVKFAPGARNKFHTHTTEQILIITDGQGTVATKEREYEALPGMVFFISPGEEHRHGAIKDSSFAHMVILGEPEEMKITGS